MSLLRPHQPSTLHTNACLQISNTKPNQDFLFSCTRFCNWELPLLNSLDYRSEVCVPRPSLLVTSYWSLLLASRKRNHPHGHLESSSLATEQFTGREVQAQSLCINRQLTLRVVVEKNSTSPKSRTFVLQNQQLETEKRPAVQSLDLYPTTYTSRSLTGVSLL